MKVVDHDDSLPPDDLAGYQHIVDGEISKWDIIVSVLGLRPKQWADDKQIGQQIVPEMDFFDVYRKMPCPKPGDHDKAWKQVQIDSEKVFKGYKEMADKCLDRAKTNDGGKPPLAHLPWKAIREVSQVQLFGHKKYEDFHNYKKGMEVSRHLSCATRHIADFMDGNDLDTESGRNHLAHAACRLLFVLENLADGTAIDDRYKNKTK